MPESGAYGSVRGALSNERPYRDQRGGHPSFEEGRIRCRQSGEWIENPTQVEMQARMHDSCIREVPNREYPSHEDASEPRDFGSDFWEHSEDDLFEIDPDSGECSDEDERDGRFDDWS